MKTFASALLAASALGATALIDYTMTGTYYLTRDPTVSYSVKSVSSDTGVDSDTVSLALAGNMKFGYVKYTLTLATQLASKTFTNVCTMVVSNMTKASTQTNTAKPTGDVAFEQFACYKDSQATSDDLKGMSCWIVGFYTPTNVLVTNFYDVHVYNYKSASSHVTTTEHTVGDITWGAGAAATENAKDLTTNFGTTATWTPVYEQKKTDVNVTADSTIVINTSSATETATVLNWTEVTAATQIALPKVTIVVLGTVLTTVTSEFTETFTADADFSSNGPKFATQMRSFNQSNARMMFGFMYKPDATSATNFAKDVKLAKPTIAATDAERWTTQDLSNTADATTLWSTTVGKPTGVTTAQSKLDLFVWDDLTTGNKITVRVQQTSVLTAAGATANIQLQQMTCLNFYTLSSTIQYLCFLADTTIAGNATAEQGTVVIKQSVWHNTVAPTLAMYSASNSTGTNVKKFDDDTAVNLRNAAQKGFIVFEGLAASVNYGQEATFTDSMPNSKFAHMMGNYVQKDRKTVITTMGFSGAASTAGAGAISNVNLTAGTLKTIKDGCNSAGFAGNALSLAGAAFASTVSATAAFSITTDPNAPTTTCTASTKDECMTNHSLVSGALSTIASVGAAIAALAMSF